jgi:hypothetical protein
VILDSADHGTEAQARTVYSSRLAVTVSYELWSVSGAWSQDVMTTTMICICCPVCEIPGSWDTDGSHLTVQSVLQCDPGLDKRSRAAIMRLTSATACLAV